MSFYLILYNIKMKKLFFNIILIYIFINEISSEKLLKIPFKLYQTSKFFNDNPDIIVNRYMNQLIIKLSIGIPFQKFNMSLDLNDNYYSCFLENNFEYFNFSHLYNKTNSSTYNCEKTKKSFPIEQFNQAEVFSDKINFLGNGKMIEKNFKFLLIDTLYKTIFTPGLIGLALKFDNRQIDDYSFLYQLKKYKLIDSEIFYFDFEENEKEGNFILGENLFNNENYLKIKVGYISQASTKLLWSFNFDSVYYGKSKNIGKADGVFGLNYGMTIGTSDYEEIIKQFFSKEKNCFLNKTNIGSLYLKYYWCEKENLIENKIQNLTFELKSINYNFTFSGKDLFFEEGNKKYFKILFKFELDQPYWYLGPDFLKKYKIRFDHERKLLYIPLKEDLSKNNKINEGINDFWNLNNLLKSWQFWTVTILCIVVIGLIVFIIIYIKKYPKKKKVYELDETDNDYDYNKKEHLAENNIN